MKLKLKPIEPEKVMFEAELTVRDTIKIVAILHLGHKFTIEKQLNAQEARILRNSK